MYNKKRKKEKLIFPLTVTVDNECLASNCKTVTSIFPSVCSIIINGVIEDED